MTRIDEFVIQPPASKTKEDLDQIAGYIVQNKYASDYPDSKLFYSFEKVYYDPESLERSYLYGVYIKNS